MSILKIFDIVYEPVKLICAACRQPLKNADAANERKKIELEKQLELQAKEFEANLNLRIKREEMNITTDERRLNEEINQMIEDKNFQRDMEKAEFIKKYREDTIKLGASISESLGAMSIELRKRTQDLVLDKTKEYITLQTNAKQRFKEDLKELNELFGDDEESKSMMRKISFDQVQAIMETTRKFMSSMDEDIKGMQKNIDMITTQAVANTEKYLSTMDSLRSISNSAQNGEIDYSDKKYLK